MTTLLLAYPGFARDHRVLNGAWTLAPAKSNFAGQSVVQTGIQSGKNLKSKSRWDHDVLKVTTTQSGAVTLESYALTSEGAMTVTVVRPRQKPIALAFQRQ